MRELKFRAWIGSDNTDRVDEEMHYEYGLCLLNGKYADISGYGDIYGAYEEVPIEQYTSLKDKNGKEIYEGDIVKCYSTADEPCLAVVKYGRMPDICGHEYCPCKAGFYLDEKVYFDEDFGEDDDHGDIEVIGNIHENKELVGGEE